ncbi:MAG TPA: undecaprenyl-diphosphate phosphatase [Candidatus Blautia intestinavium]|nr:undecaprenyl-diphosphate phosphatase [Candidatus Blautia intestinavium]HJD25866.1 undecaprenyl-diphosphate phosphatase [Candidatus Blautia intestinipullorum]
MNIVEFIKAVFLGIVEGITEWLPISSTGHMILVDEFIKLDVTPEFKEFFLVVIQLGAILAVVVLYWSKLWPFYIREIPKKKQAAIRSQGAVSRWVLTFVEKYCDKEKWILWFKILVACIPTIVIALPFNDVIEEKFNNYVVVAIALIVYGVIFIIIENYNKKRRPVCTSLEDMSFKTAFLIGIFQVLSVIPGTSRSGSTIIGGILVGTSRTVAAEFTFFLAIPVMFGASLLKLVKFGFAFTGTEVVILVTGVVVAFVVSILAIKFLMGYIKKHDFKAFGWYRIILGVLVLGYFIGKNVLMA